MKLTPSEQTKNLLITASKLGARLFRMNTGLAWVGSRTVNNPDGSLTIFDPRPFKAGVKGMSDATGWITVIVTPDMVGQKVAVYAAMEVKQGSGRLSPDQRAFGDAVIQAGGRFVVAREDADVAGLFTNRSE